VPGGVAGEISGLLGASDLTPAVLLLSFLTAIVLGAGHAVTPGHGKTIMAAYLVGTKGTTRHAFGLGLATAVSHTIGVLILAMLIVAAGTALPADRVYPILSAVSGVIVVVIGAWLLASQVTKWLRSRPAGANPSLGGRLVPATADGHGHPHASPDLAAQYGARYAMTSGASGALAATVPAMSPSTAAVAASDAAGMHRHGWRVHSHVPAKESDLSWRSLFALGLSGGLVPSTNALLILVATVAAGRAPYGIVLVIAFGIGMAAVLVGVGLALVYASGMVARAPRNPLLMRMLTLAPVAAAMAVLVLGLFLTSQALSGNAVL
jgi:ABC-type nickel/cobalt efflux system permease component RcnA